MSNFNCEKCIHKNVCKKVEEIKKIWERLILTREWQEIAKMNIKITINCADHYNDNIKIVGKKEGED